MNVETGPIDSVSRTAPSERDIGDIRLLCALAASHSLFGLHDTAAQFLAVAAWIDPRARRVLELRAMVELRRGHIDAARAATASLRELREEISGELSIIERRAAAHTDA